MQSMTKEKYEDGTKRGMNRICSVNKIFLYQTNGMECYIIMKIIAQAFHRVQDHQNRNPE
jgi:predicted metallopeptidase